MSRRWRAVLAAAILLAGGLAGLLRAARERLQSRLIVGNRPGQPVAVLRVTVGGETLSFRDIPDRGRRPRRSASRAMTTSRWRAGSRTGPGSAEISGT